MKKGQPKKKKSQLSEVEVLRRMLSIPPKPKKAQKKAEKKAK